MNTRDAPLVLPCTTAEINFHVVELWPILTAARGVDWREYRSILDGHFGVGFSIRLFGLPHLDGPNATSRAAYRALEDLLRALEDRGFEVTRDGNQWQPGRLVLGWAAARRASHTMLSKRFCDLSEHHVAVVERRERLQRERAARDADEEIEA